MKILPQSNSIRRALSAWLVALLCMACPLSSFSRTDSYLALDHVPTISQEVDYYHDAISRRVLRMANRIDELFADERILEESNESVVQLNVLTRYVEGENPVLKLSLKGRLALPYLEERLQFVFDTDDKERDLKDELRGTDVTTEDERSLFTGVRFLARDTQKFRLSTDAGLRWRGGPVPFARLRARKTFAMDDWVVRLTQSVFWYYDRGFGETTAIDFERQLDETHFFRATPSVTWSEVSQGVDFRQRIAVFHFARPRRLIAAELDIQGHTKPSTVIDKYEFALRFRRPLHRDWVFLEVAPGVQFPRERGYELTPLITIKTELLFGDVPRISNPFARE